MAPEVVRLGKQRTEAELAALRERGEALYERSVDVWAVACFACAPRRDAREAHAECPSSACPDSPRNIQSTYQGSPRNIQSASCSVLRGHLAT